MTNKLFYGDNVHAPGLMLDIPYVGQANLKRAKREETGPQERLI